MKACASCGQQVANRAKFCPSCGAATADTPAPAAGAPELLTAGAEPSATATTTPTDAADRTLVERILGGDWRAAAYVAGPSALVAVALSLAATSYLLWTGNGSDDAFGFGHSAGGFFHSAAGLLAMAFGSPLFTRAGGSDTGFGSGGGYGAGAAPLTISLLVLATYALLLRTYLPDATASTRVAGAVRASVLTSFALAMLSFGAFSTSDLGDQARLHLTSSPGRVFGWSLLFFTVVGTVVAVRPRQLWATRTAESPTLDRLTGEWLLPIQGALVAMTTAVVLGGVTAIVIFVAEADGSRLDVLKALPILLAYLVNLGVDVFQISMGAALHASASGGDGGSASVSLFDRHGLSAGYFGLLALPPVAIMAGVAWIRRYRGSVEPRILARSCYRMALPAVVVYVVLAVASRAGFEYGGPGAQSFGSGHAGPQVLLGALILAAWFVVVGFAAGRYLLSEPPPAGSTEPLPQRPGWLGRTVSAGPVALVALAVAILAGIGGVATANDKDHSGDFGFVGSLLLFGVAGVSESNATVTTGSGTAIAPVPSPIQLAPVPPTGAAAPAALRDLAVAEETYYTTNGTYTTDQFQLDVGSDPTVYLDVVRADATSYCAEAFGQQDGQSYSYDSTVGSVVTGSTC
jgi:hypothetical protein